MSTQAPWLALAVDWQDSDMFENATPEERLAWVCLLCHAKTNGRAGFVRFKVGHFTKRFQISKSAATSMLTRAERDGAIKIGEDGVISVVNWRQYQDPKHRPSKAQLATEQGLMENGGSFSKSSQKSLPTTTHHTTPHTSPPTPSQENPKEDSLSSKPAQKRTTVKRERNAWWDAVVAVFFTSGVPRGMKSKVGELAAGFQTLGATEDEIRKRRARIREAWGAGKDTAFSVLNHWGEFAEDAGPSPGQPQRSVARIQAEPGKYDDLPITRVDNFPGKSGGKNDG